jgi:heme A synthase
MIPIHYIGWMIIVLAILRFNNKAHLDVRWKLAFSLFTALFSLGRLAVYYGFPDLANVLNILCAAAFLLPFLKINYLLIKDVEKISDTSLLLGMSIIVLLS